MLGKVGFSLNNVPPKFINKNISQVDIAPISNPIISNNQGVSGLSYIRPVSTISFTGKLVDGVMYSNHALALGDKMVTPEEAKKACRKNQDKIKEIKTYKAKNNQYTNSRAGIIEAATAIGKNGKAYTACNVDFYSSRWGMPSGMLASCMAMNNFNNSLKAIAVTNENHDRKSLQWLANTSDKLGKSRGGKNLQVITEKNVNGKKIPYVRTLADLKGFVPTALPKIKNVIPDTGISQSKQENVVINKIAYSASAQAAAKKLADSKGLKVDELIKSLVLKSQEEANKLDDTIIKAKGKYDNAPVSHYRYISAVAGDNGKIYTAHNTEFYDSGFMTDAMCSERTATAKAVNGGANKINAIAINNNQGHSDAPCAECLGWLSTDRGGGDLLIARIQRDGKGNKTDKVQVNTLGEMLTDIHTPSAIVK